jgi:hypothetical protein
MIKLSSNLILLAASLLFAAHTLHAQIFTAVEFERGLVYYDSFYTLGYRFLVKTNMEVTSLGAYDHNGDGLNTSHTLAIWSTNGGDALVSAVVPAGTVAPLAGHFRYVNCSNVLLTAGTEYVIGASEYGHSQTLPWDPYMSYTVGLTTAPGIEYIIERYVFTPNGGLVFPHSEYNPYPNGDFGPTFQFRLADQVRATRQGTNMLLDWSTNRPSQLEMTTEFPTSGTSVWTLVTNGPPLVWPMTGPATFFRLQYP